LVRGLNRSRSNTGKKSIVTGKKRRGRHGNRTRKKKKRKESIPLENKGPTAGREQSNGKKGIEVEEEKGRGREDKDIH